MKKILFTYTILVQLILSGCTTYTKFDKMYQKGEFEQAYKTLRAKGNETKDSYKERELKAVIQLVISGKNEYLPILDSLLLKPMPKDMKSWQHFARAWIRFVSASTRNDFINVLSILPDKPFKETRMEQMRLIIHTQSLLQLKKYEDILKLLKLNSASQKNTDLLYVKGLAYMKLGQNDDAKQNFQTMIRLSDNNKLKALGYFYIAEILEKENDSAKAEKYYFQSWKLEPKNGELNFRIGRLLKKRNYNDLHYRFYRASLRINENLAESWFYLNIQ